MGEVQERLRALDLVEVPDLSERIRAQEPRRSEPGPPRRRAIALLALTVAAAGFAFAVRAFRATEQPIRLATKIQNGRIAYVVEGDDRIYAANPDASDPVSLAQGGDPDWSPDGTRLAFLTGSGFRAELHIGVFDPEARTLGSVTGYPLEPYGTGPVAWSPDGRRIAFASEVGLFVMNADGTGIERVTRYRGDHACFDLEPSWSPDGTSIAFAVLCEGGSEGIWRVDLDGSDRTQLVAGAYETDDYRSPVWSPDGTTIAFVHTRWGPDGDAHAVLSEMEPDGSGVREVVEGVAFDQRVAWSPDGTQIAFERYETSGARLFLVNVDGTDARPLTDPDLDVCCPAWQPVPVDASASPSPAAAAAFPAAVVPTLTAALPVGTEGGGSLLFAEGSVWLSVRSNDASEGGRIVRIDPATNQVVARIPVAAVPTWEVGGGGMAAGAGSVWVTGSGQLPGDGFGALLQRIDPTTNEVVATIPLDGGTGYDVTVHETGVWALISGHDGFTRVAEIDPATNGVIATVELEQQWAHRIVPTEAGLLVLEHRTFGGGSRAGVFSVIDPGTAKVVATNEPDLPGSAWALVVFDGQTWTDAGGWALARIDPAIGEAVSSVRPVLGVSGSEGLAAGEGGIWFVGYNPNSGNERPQTLNRLDPRTGAIDVSAEIGRRGTSIAAGGGAVWVLLSDGTLLRYDLEPPPAEPSVEDLEPFASPLVAAFMEARIEGTGADAFLSGEAMDGWGSVGSGSTSLYSPPDLRFESFAILSVASLRSGAFDVRVRMFGAHLDGEDEWLTEPLFDESLLVGPGEDPAGLPRLLLVTGARPAD